MPEPSYQCLCLSTLPHPTHTLNAGQDTNEINKVTKSRYLTPSPNAYIPQQRFQGGSVPEGARLLAWRGRDKRLDLSFGSFQLTLKVVSFDFLKAYTGAFSCDYIAPVAHRPFTDRVRRLTGNFSTHKTPNRVKEPHFKKFLFISVLLVRQNPQLSNLHRDFERQLQLPEIVHLNVEQVLPVQVQTLLQRGSASLRLLRRRPL